MSGSTKQPAVPTNVPANRDERARCKTGRAAFHAVPPVSFAARSAVVVLLDEREGAVLQRLQTQFAVLAPLVGEDSAHLLIHDDMFRQTVVCRSPISADPVPRGR
jgi:hypothetical protein